MVCVEEATQVLGINGVSSFEPIGTGVYTKAYRVDHQDQRLVLKIIDGGKEGKFNQHTANWILGGITEYDNVIRRMGIHVPEILTSNVFRGGSDGEWKIAILVTDGGIPADQIIASADPFVVEGLVAELIQSFEPILRYIVAGNGRKVGFDSKTANFTRNGRISYIDGMPPRLDGLLDYPDPVNKDIRTVNHFRYYTTRGILLVCQNQLSRLRPDCRYIIKSQVLKAASKLGHPQYFLNSASEKFVHSSPSDKRRIILGLSPTDIYDVREIACEIASDGNHHPELDEIFHLTHLFTKVDVQRHTEAQKLLLAMAGLN